VVVHHKSVSTLKQVVCNIQRCLNVSLLANKQDVTANGFIRVTETEFSINVPELIRQCTAVGIPKFSESPVTDVKFSDNLKQRNSNAIETLYAGFQCGSCCKRFSSSTRAQGNSDYSQHLDWHFTQNRQAKTKRIVSRKWYLSVDNWIQLNDSKHLKYSAADPFAAYSKFPPKSTKNRARILASLLTMGGVTVHTAMKIFKRIMIKKKKNGDSKTQLSC